jgi:hypothetical protein
MMETVENYLLIKKHLAELIKVSGYNSKFIAHEIGMQANHFAVKKFRGN